MRVGPVILALCLSSGLLAAPPLSRQQRREQVAALAAQAAQAFNTQDFATAETLLNAQLERAPRDPVASYNLACAIAAQGRDAVGPLATAIENGYDDIRRIRREPALAKIIAASEIRAILSDWPQTLELHLAANIERSELLVPKTKAVRDEDLKVAYLSHFDPASNVISQQELAAISRWASATIFPVLADPAQRELDPWVLLVLPTRQNFTQWAVSTYGDIARGSIAVIGGAYDHDTKRLVAQDLGSTLRHEFMHILHWRDMTRRGQTHPVWIQEGICSLAEDYDLAGDLDTGVITPAHSWRTNAVVRMARNNNTLTLKRLFALDAAGFAATRPLAAYAQARTFFMFLLSRDKLADWYAAYCETFRQDSTGLQATLATLSVSEAELENLYRTYIKSLAEVPENIADGAASMGVEVSAGNGEGPVISMTYGHPRFRSGDVLLTFAGHPVRDIPELVRLLSKRQVGEEIPFTLRRGRKIVAVSQPLIAK